MAIIPTEPIYGKNLPPHMALHLVMYLVQQTAHTPLLHQLHRDIDTDVSLLTVLEHQLHLAMLHYMLTHCH